VTRPASIANEVPRPPCVECGSKSLAFQVSIADEAGVTDGLSASLRPGDQSLGWSRRWEAAQDQLVKLLAPRNDELSGKAIKDARDELLSFYVRAFHIKDALKVEAKSLGLDKNAVEKTVKEDPALSLLGDLANLVKHHGKGRNPISGDRPEIVGASGTGVGEGWRLDLSIRHRGRDLDGIAVAQDAVAAWQRLLAEWGLV
jgi:hypothetical protein